MNKLGSLIDDSPKVISFLRHPSKWKTILNSWNTQNPSISADLEPQIICYQLSRVGGIIWIEIIEYTFCVIVISEMNSIIFYSVKILNLVQKLLLSKYYSNHVNVLKFRNLMTSKNKTVLTKLCKLIKIIEKVFCDPGWNIPTIIYMMYLLLL